MATPVVTNPVPASTTADVDIKGFTGEERHNWRKTGELPNREAKPQADSTPAKESSEAAPNNDGKTAESAPASEAGKHQEKPEKRSNAESRIKELLAENKRLKEAAQAPKTQADPSPAKPVEAKPQTLEPPKKPEQKDYPDWDKFEAAKEKYFEDLADFKAKKAVQEDRQQRAAEAENERLNKSVTEAKTRYSDFDDVIKPALQAIAPTVQDGKLVPQIHPLVEARINRSSVFPDLLYVLGVDAKDLAAFTELARTDPFAAIDKIVVLEQLVQQKLSKGKPNSEASRGADGKFTEKSPERPKVSNAPAPGSEVSGRGTPPPDDVENAVANDDGSPAATRRYMEAANRRDLSKIRK